MKDAWKEELSEARNHDSGRIWWNRTFGEPEGIVR